MAGIYIHIPFCRQHCHYCNFHFATSLKQKAEMVEAICLEIGQRRSYLEGKTVSTIYFGGGTPSLLLPEELQRILSSIREQYVVESGAEVTLEANPDDLDEAILQQWKAAGINRLSIGIQSFFEEDLRWMHRAHNAAQALEAMRTALAVFPNTSIDLIYGSPGLTNEKWKANVDRVIAAGVPHISCYALTVEPKTPLAKMIREKRSPATDPDLQSEQFLLLMEWLGAAGYEQYEISNFALPGRRSRHNSSYWGSAPGKGIHYLGIGPSAHSYNGKERQWNISNNSIYIRSVREGMPAFEKEILTPEQELNEYIMTALRTSEGIDLESLSPAAAGGLRKKAERFMLNGLMTMSGSRIILTKEGKLLADGLAAELFQ